MAEIADIPEEIPDILIIRVDVLILFHRIRHLMYIRRRPIWGEGRWGKFYFCINPFSSTCFDSAYIFFFFFMYNETTVVGSTSIVCSWTFEETMVNFKQCKLVPTLYVFFYFKKRNSNQFAYLLTYFLAS